VTYDTTTDVAYVELRATGPADVLGPALLLESDPAFAGHVIADFTLADGRLAGFELQHASACLPVDLIVTAERIDGANLQRRFDQRLGRLLASDLSLTSGSRNALRACLENRFGGEPPNLFLPPTRSGPPRGHL